MHHRLNFFAPIVKNILRIKSTVLTLITCAIGFSSPSVAFAYEPIMLSGLTVRSTITEIEAVFGQCGKADQNGMHYCGDSDFNAYKLNKNGAISEIYFDCKLLSACKYPIDVLANILFEIYGNIMSMNKSDEQGVRTVTLYSRTGDILTLQSFDENGLNTNISLSRSFHQVPE